MVHKHISSGRRCSSRYMLSTTVAALQTRHTDGLLKTCAIEIERKAKEKNNCRIFTPSLSMAQLYIISKAGV